MCTEISESWNWVIEGIILFDPLLTHKPTNNPTNSNHNKKHNSTEYCEQSDSVLSLWFKPNNYEYLKNHIHFYMEKKMF